MKKYLARMICLVLCLILTAGLMPVTALAAHETISELTVSLSVPKAGQTVSYNATYREGLMAYTGVDSSTTKNGITWTDLSTGTTLRPGDTFIFGHQYKVAILVQTVSNYWELDWQPDYTLNGEDVTGYTPSNMAWATYACMTKTYDPLAGYIDNVSVSITAPVAGYYPSTSATANNSTYYVGSPHANIAPVVWYNETTGQTLKSSDQFKSGNAYSVRIVVCAEDGWEFRRSAGTISASATLNGKSAEVVDRWDSSTIMAIDYSFPALGGATIISAGVTGLEAPKADAKPDTTASAMGSSYSIYGTIDWYDVTADEYLDSGDRFILGHDYTAVIWLQADYKNGFNFSVTSSDKPDVTVTVDGVYAKVNKAYEWGPDAMIEVQRNFGPCPSSHVHKLTYYPRVEATCMKEGQEAYYRCDCGMHYKDSAGKEEINFGVWGIIPKKSHAAGELDYDGKQHWQVCQYGCGTVVGSKISHFGGTPTCGAMAKCVVCGSEYGEILQHSWSSDWAYQSSKGHAHVCQYQNCEEHDTVQAHVPGPAATEKSAQTCTACGYVIAPAKGHTHSLTKVSAKSPTCMNPGVKAHYACSGCGKLFTDLKAATEATEDSLAVASLGHKTSENWKSDAKYHWRTCVNSGCGAALEETRMLHSDDNKDGSCDTCRYAVSTGSSTSSVPSSEPASSEPASSEVSSEPASSEPESSEPVSEPASSAESSDISSDEPSQETGSKLPGSEQHGSSGKLDSQKPAQGVPVWVFIAIVALLVAVIVVCVAALLSKKKR